MNHNRKFCWSKEATKELIELYQNKPVLYCTTDPAYKDKHKRYAALTSIQSDLLQRPFCANQCLTVDDIKQKVHGLRSQYFKEVSKLKSSACSGSSTDDLIQPKLWCFYELEFLRSTDPIRASVSNLDSQNTATMFEDEGETVFEGSLDDLMESEILYPDSPTTSASGSIPCKKRKQNTNKTLQVAQLISTATNVLQNTQENRFRQTESEDDLQIFGRCVASELKKIKSESTVRQLKRRIYNLIIDSQEEDDL